MKNYHNPVFRAVLLTAVLSSILGAFAYAQLDKILKGGAIAAAVDKFGPDINKGINKLVDNRNLGSGQATKVVPILSIGKGEAVGAVQVIGQKSQLDKVKAVAQLEGDVRLISTVRLRALIPISARSISNIKRVPGVGVSALVDIRL
jgi:hypothetical protein